MWHVVNIAGLKHCKLEESLKASKKPRIKQCQIGQDLASSIEWQRQTGNITQTTKWLSKKSIKQVEIIKEHSCWNVVDLQQFGPTSKQEQAINVKEHG